MRAVALLAGVLLLTAGCLGMGGDETDTEASPSSVEESATNDSQSPGASPTEDHDHEPAPEKHWVNITGEVSGAHAVFVGINSFENETFEVPSGVQSLEITVRAEGGELYISVLDPDCTDEPEILGFVQTSSPSCEESGSTMNGTSEEVQPDGGTFEFSQDQPKEGNWTIEMSKSDSGTNAVGYTITAAYVDVHEPSSDHEH